jgi:hypothetical protein
MSSRNSPARWALFVAAVPTIAAAAAPVAGSSEIPKAGGIHSPVELGTVAELAGEHEQVPRVGKELAAFESAGRARLPDSEAN